ncbi:MAG: kelch repeat-containing protein [Anaerolineales bacterium]
MRNRKIFLTLFSALLFLSACGSAQPLITTVILPTIIKETQIVEVTRVVQQVVVVTVEVPREITQAPPAIPVEILPTPILPSPVPPFTPLVNINQGISLPLARAQHTATLLLDGRVLLVGGSISANEQTAEVQIFDPATGVTNQAASLNTPRHGHTATLLLDGRVLVTSGYNHTHQWLDDSEVYDPSTNEWTVIPMLATHGVGHTATMMKDGRVLVVGGADASGQGTDRVEIFDPDTNSWWGAMPLGSDRASHTAQLLDDGRVLVAGGGGVLGYPDIGDALFYDPYTNTWTPTGPMDKPRIYGESVLLLDGRVLVTGGINLEDTVPGGFPRKISISAEIYDPNLNIWTATGDLLIGRYGHTMMSSPAGRVMVIGGSRDYDCCFTTASFISEIELYDLNTGVWSLGGYLPQPGIYSDSVLLTDSHILVTGGKAGENGLNFLSDTWLITPLSILP